MGLSVQSIFAATLVYVIGFPLRKTLIPLWGHYWRQKPRFFVLAIFICLMLWEFGGKVGLILIVDTVAFLEFFDRIEGDPAKLGRAARAVLIPAAYFFIGLVLVFCYNDLIASVEFVGKYSETYNWLDLYQVQKATLLNPRLLWARKVLLTVGTDYYIAFPCMHIALPLIILMVSTRVEAGGCDFDRLRRCPGCGHPLTGAALLP
jgi:hypothetical protein